MASKYELKVEKILRLNHYKYKKEVTINGLYGYKTNPLRFDFEVYSPVKCLIEVDGEYHFKPIRGVLAFQRQKAYDERKNNYCLGHNIKLIRIPYWEIENLTIEKIFNTPDFVVTSMFHNYRLKPPY